MTSDEVFEVLGIKVSAADITAAHERRMPKQRAALRAQPDSGADLPETIGGDADRIFTTDDRVAG